jgi:hydrogenase-4 membrane subunit HyfE
MNVKAIAGILYGLFAASSLIVGASVLLLDTGLLPEVVSRAVSNAAHGDARALHIIQEFGAFLVFAGLIAFWFARHYDQSRFFHWALTFAFALVALAHWFDVRGAHSKLGPLVNSVPFALFLLVGLLRLSSDRKMHRET